MLPPESLTAFEAKVPAGQRSAVVAGLLRDWLDQQHRAELRGQIIAGCRDMAELYLEIDSAYHPLEEELHRGLEGQSKARRRGFR